MKRKILTANAILATLPYIRKFKGKTIVIKYGGAAQINPELKEHFAQDMVLLSLVGIKIVIVHGGGKKINELLELTKIDSKFEDGLRVTSPEALEIIEMVLSGNINKEITNLLNNHGAKAIGISGKDGNFLKAKAVNFDKFGLVGQIIEVKKKVINKLINQDLIPVIAPIACDIDNNHQGFNINADLCASKIAKSLKAQKVIFLTDTLGVLDENEQIISKLDEKSIKKLKNDGIIKGGMIPKTDACLEAVNGGVKHAHIIDGRIKHSILLELFTNEGIGTVISKDINE